MNQANNKMRCATLLCSAAIWMGLSHSDAQELRLPPLFGHNMVLQQSGTDDHTDPRYSTVWGWSKARSAVLARLESGGQVVSKASTGLRLFGRSEDGWRKWEIRLKAPLQGLHDLVINQANYSIRFTNVFVGEVWVSGVNPLPRVPMDFRNLERLRREASDNVRVLELGNLSFRADQWTPSSQWVNLTSLLSDAESPESNWNAYFSHQLLRNPRSTVSAVGLILIDPRLLSGTEPDDLLPGRASAKHSSDKILGAFDAGEKAANFVKADSDRAREEYSSRISRAKRRGLGFSDPPPSDFPYSYRFKKVHYGSISELDLSVRGTIW